MGTTISFYSINNDFVKNGIMGNKGHGRYINYRGADVDVAYTPIDIFGTRWAILGEITYEEGTEEAYIIIKQVITTGLITVIIAIIIIFIFLDKFMSTPLTKILITTSDISTGEGDLTQRLVVKTTDEFGAVSHNINLFIARIQELINDVKDLAEKMSIFLKLLMDLAHQFLIVLKLKIILYLLFQKVVKLFLII